MKRITLFFMFVTTVTLAQQQPNNYYDYQNSGQMLSVSNSTNTESNIVRVENGRQPIIATFTDRTEFQDAYNADCNNPDGLVSETFDGGPGGITVCGLSVSSDGDGCFAAGVLEEGFVITSLGGTSDDVVYIPNGAIGNAIPLVGATSFADYTIVTFPDNDVYAVGQDIWENNEPTTEYRIYDEGGALLETYIVNTPTNTATFFGFIADEVISRVEMEGPNASGELFGGLEFGICNVLSVNGHLLSQISIYPNPSTDVLNIKVPASVEITGAVLYDVLGKNTGVTLVNDAINTSSLSKGIYILSLKTSAGTLTEKIIKN